MLIVETYLDKSEGKGIGLFSKNIIKEGHAYWIRNTSFDRLFTMGDVTNLGAQLFDFIKYYGFLEPTGNWYLCVDNARFCNHSMNANTINEFNSQLELQKCIASKDILPGEEILCDYRKTCITCVDELGFNDTEIL